MSRSRCFTSVAACVLLLQIPALLHGQEPSQNADSAPKAKARPNYRLRLTLENIEALQAVHPAVGRRTQADAKQVREVVFLQENGKLQRVTGDAIPLPRPSSTRDKQPLDESPRTLQGPTRTPLALESSSRKPKSNPGDQTKTEVTAKKESEGSESQPQEEQLELDKEDGAKSSEGASLELSDLQELADEAQALQVEEHQQDTGSMVQDRPTDAVESESEALTLRETEEAQTEVDSAQAKPEASPKKSPAPELKPNQEAEYHELFGDAEQEPAPVVPELDTKETQATEEAEEAEEPAETKTPATLVAGPNELPGDHKAGDEDSAECPGAPDGDKLSLETQPGDLPLEQDEHPYDAPSTRSIEDHEVYVEEPVAFSRRELKIHDDINRTLAYFLNNPETVVRRGPWALMHASLPFGVETEVVAGNRRVNALGWMCYNGVCAKQRMFQPTRSGFRTNVGPGVQGHEGQFLAILAQSRVNPEYPIKIGNRSYTIHDLVRYEMATCREKSELTFKLIGLSYYLQPDMTWRDNRGRSWNIEKLLVEEMAQPVNGQACGGTHRLMGLSYALIERQRKGQPIEGAWSRAEEYLNDYVNYTMTLQNPDGSFSTNWFESRGNKPDVKRKVQTTGHILEWLIFTLPDEHLRSHRIQLSMEYLLKTVGENPSYDWPIGPRGHALRAMALYNQRLFGAQAGQMKSYIADQGGIRIR